MIARVLSVVGRSPEATVAVWDLDADDGTLVLSASADADLRDSVTLAETPVLLGRLSEILQAREHDGWTFDTELPLSWRSLRAHPPLSEAFWEVQRADAQQLLRAHPDLEAIAFSLSPTGIRPTFAAEDIEAAFVQQLHPEMVATALQCQHAMVRIDRDGVHVAEGQIGDMPSRRVRRSRSGPRDERDRSREGTLGV